MSLKPRILILLGTCIVCFLGILAPPSADAADLNAGIKAYQKGDYVTALNELKPLAQRGNAEAQYNVGKIYHTRRKTLGDQQEAIKWYTKAAEQKHALSQYTLGSMYAKENKPYKDYVKSFVWYTLSLSQGNESARKGRDGVLFKMTPAQVNQGQELYNKFHKKIYGGK